MLGFPTTTDRPKPMARRRRGAPVYARNGMVATAQPLATAAGLEVLANGGNAVDAAIAAALVDAVTMPASCGIGGDLFAIVSKPAKGGGYSELMSVISSGISPRNASLEFMQERGELGGRVLAQTGPLSPSVPGFPAGIDALLEQFGTRPLTELSKAAIGYAADGFPITQILASHLAGERALLEQYPASAAVFLPDGKTLGPGEMLRQPGLAGTIDQIAREGSQAFYQGSIAKRMTDWLGQNGGALTAEDFSDHAAWVGAPLQSTYRDKIVYQTGLPTQGFVQLEAQNIVEGFDLSAVGTDSAQGIHYMVEALKRSFHDRHLYAADPNFVDVPMEKLLSKEWAAERRATIDPNQALLETKSTYLYPGDTTYLCAIDGDGLMISLIISVSGAWGSGVIAGDTGVLLNNRAGHCFSLDPDHPNRYEPGKKTMHTLNCYLIAERDGTPIVVGGTPGGDSQTQWNLQCLTALIDEGQDVQAAVEVPRWSIWPATYPVDVGHPFRLVIEDQVGQQTIDGLRERGHDVVTCGPWSQSGTEMIISRDPESGVLVGGCDPRSEGIAAGI
ncbi:MAG: gamma-glutamyltransferase family protein [Thermomicrobiales bacterium]|nr:gamma-glutamyltransferase family protein [Thermomicrobiales bacterium]